MDDATTDSLTTPLNQSSIAMASTRYASALAVASSIGFIVFGVTVGSQFVPVDSLYAWHPTLMSVAIALCGTSSALGVYARTIPPSSARLRAFWTHMGLNVIGGLCWLCGAYAIYANKRKSGKAHFTSNHGVVGALATAVVLCAALPLGDLSFGALGMLARIDSILGTRWSRHLASVKRAHRLSSHLAMCLGIVAASMRTGHVSIGYGEAGRAVADFALWGGALALGISAVSTPEWNRIK